MNVFFKENKLFTICGILAVVIVLIALFAPWIAPHDPYEAIMKNSLKPPTAEYPCGTDQLGRCELSRIIYGTRASLQMTVTLVVIVFTVGTLLGMIAGYFGGAVDAVIMRFSDMMIAFPGMVLAIAVAGMLGPSLFNTVIALAVVSWTKYARLSRSLVLKIKNSQYISAAVVTGAKTGHIFGSYLAPNIIPTMVVTAAMDVGTMMLELAALSFLGLGAQPPTPEWGLMLNEGRQYLQTAPWLMLFPGIAIFMVVSVFNLMGDGLRDILDPRQEG